MLGRGYVQTKYTVHLLIYEHIPMDLPTPTVGHRLFLHCTGIINRRIGQTQSPKLAVGSWCGKQVWASHFGFGRLVDTKSRRGEASDGLMSFRSKVIVILMSFFSFFSSVSLSADTCSRSIQFVANRNHPCFAKAICSAVAALFSLLVASVSPSTSNRLLLFFLIWTPTYAQRKTPQSKPHGAAVWDGRNEAFCLTIWDCDDSALQFKGAVAVNGRAGNDCLPFFFSLLFFLFFNVLPASPRRMGTGPTS